MALTLRYSKKKDGTVVFACTRPDGSATWQRRKHPFFILHDLGHFAIETTLGLRYGFYGLLADGWNITDFGDRPFPPHTRPEALFTEAVAGLFDQERGTGVVLDAEAFNNAVAAVMQEMGQPHERRITPAELDAFRSCYLELQGQWTRLAPGDTLTLSFETA